MLILKEMRWSHAFSYGANNVIRFNRNDLLQLVGRNGHGKSSIALILEEVVYNKNSKGIKKANILNRYSKSKNYTIELDFDKDADEYSIVTTRGATQTVKLLKNGEDISSHTSTGTYKLIEEIWGFDHKAFTQIVYQSSAFSLEFLTSTDTTRKKFLIDLLNLTKYSKALEYYKDLAKELSKDAELADSKCKLYKSVLDKYSNTDLEPRELLEVPILDTRLSDELLAVNTDLSNINSINAKIVKNNSYKEILSGLYIEVLEQPESSTPYSIRVSELIKRLAQLKSAASGVVSSKCPSCGQAVDNSHKLKMVEEATAEIPSVNKELAEAKSKLQTLAALDIAYKASVQCIADTEKYQALIDPTLPNEVLDKADMLIKQQNISKNIQDAKANYDSIVSRNLQISSHNARIEVIKAELHKAQDELVTSQLVRDELVSRLTNIQILVKTFGTSGLVAYKIECMVKDLEEATNKYLQDMSDGRFQLGFKMNSSDKLDVVITDNGTDIDIMALSNGELARVNISTLLAIRKLMQALSSSKINLLILDETIESLDVDGKERLVEVLLKEESLNTILVSHGFSHPLLEKLSIVKENNISRIES